LGVFLEVVFLKLGGVASVVRLIGGNEWTCTGMYRSRGKEKRFGRDRGLLEFGGFATRYHVAPWKFRREVSIHGERSCPVHWLWRNVLGFILIPAFAPWLIYFTDDRYTGLTVKYKPQWHRGAPGGDMWLLLICIWTPVVCIIHNRHLSMPNTGTRRLRTVPNLW
jgi:hypothetical protein